jgi:predicted glycosyltransferase
MSKRFHERLGIPDRKPFSQVDFKQNFLAPIIRDNKEKGDEFWVSYGKKGKLKDLITELEVAFKPILNGEHLTALAENKN